MEAATCAVEEKKKKKAEAAHDPRIQNAREQIQLYQIATSKNQMRGILKDCLNSWRKGGK